MAAFAVPIESLFKAMTDPEIIRRLDAIEKRIKAIQTNEPWGCIMPLTFFMTLALFLRGCH